MLQIVVSDTGPGMQGQAEFGRQLPASTDADPISTGVGLPNIRDRLAQAYGEGHRFEVGDATGGGFEVLIEVPFEQRQETAPAALAPPRRAATG
jgi:sensor histidine kinase YesM